MIYMKLAQVLKCDKCEREWPNFEAKLLQRLVQLDSRLCTISDTWGIVKWIFAWLLNKLINKQITTKQRFNEYWLEVTRLLEMTNKVWEFTDNFS